MQKCCKSASIQSQTQTQTRINASAHYFFILRTDYSYLLQFDARNFIKGHRENERKQFGWKQKLLNQIGWDNFSFEDKNMLFYEIQTKYKHRLHSVSGNRNRKSPSKECWSA